jgi:crotonobetainyl-CoA:carnitine CoA-transferase CaiB-like acyl-CoA transferase
MSATPGSTRWAGPELGQHTEQILRDELGMAPEEIARLRECGAI